MLLPLLLLVLLGLQVLRLLPLLLLLLLFVVRVLLLPPLLLCSAAGCLLRATYPPVPDGRVVCTDLIHLHVTSSKTGT